MLRATLPVDFRFVLFRGACVADERFGFRLNSSWLQCTPLEGTVNGQSQEVVVSFSHDASEIRLYRGAVTFRTDLGFNRTVMVVVKACHSRPFSKGLEAEDGKPEGGFVKVKDATTSGGDYVHSPEESDEGKVSFTFSVPEEGVYYVSARNFIPEEDFGLHDSFVFTLDGGERHIWVLVGRPGHWFWSLVNARDGDSPFRLRLKQGSHTLTIYSREKLARLDKLVMTNSPYADDGN